MPAVINARVDLYIKNVGEPASRFDETVQRSKAYLAAGADCIYPFGLADMDTIARLVKAVERTGQYRRAGRHAVRRGS